MTFNFLLFIKMTDFVDQNKPVEATGNGDVELKERFESIKRELLQVWWPEKSDDLVEIEQWVLDWKFAEFLLKNESCLTTLKTYVKTINKDGLSKKAWKSLKELEKFLDDIWDTERMKKDYDEFMEKIQNPKKLNTLKSWEIRRLNLYLWSHEDEALAAYKAMKPVVWKYFENKMKSEDKRFFEEVWNTLKDNYADNDKFFESDFGKLSESSKDLYDLAWNLWVKQWDGRNLSEWDITIWENSIISKKSVMDKFNDANKKRIDNVKSWILSLVAEVKDQLWVKWWKVVIKSSWAELTSEALLSLLSSKEAFKNLPVVENEWNTDHLKNALTEVISSEEIKSGLENLDQMQHDDGHEWGGDGHEWEWDGHEWEWDGHEWDWERHETSTNTYEEKKENFKVKLTGLKDKIKELWFYDGNEEWDSIKFDIAKVKEHLEWLKEKSWRQLEVDTTSVDRWAWTVAVQIALNYLSTKEGNSSFNVQWIDWIRKDKTQAWVRAFQEKFWLRKDGLPGKDTISKLVEELAWSSSDGWEENKEWDDKKEWDWGEKKEWGDKKEGDEWKEDREATVENIKIKEKIDKFDINNPILDLSELESLSESDANQILEWMKAKLNGQTLQKPILLKLNWLSALDNKVAEKLSKFEWWVAIDKILNNINFENCDSEITILKALTPETNEKIKIIAPTQEICDKLKQKGVNKVEVIPAS